MMSVDRIDSELLKALAQDGRATYAELGQRVRLSPNSVAERVRRLRRDGILEGFTVVLNTAGLGRPLGVLSDVKLREGVSRVTFAENLANVPQVIGALRLTGAYDYQLHIVTASAEELEQIIDLLKRDYGVIEINSRLILREVPVDKARVLDS